MTAESANAMLKTLEDPPSQVMFLFTTSQPEELLKTIISRVRCISSRAWGVNPCSPNFKKKFPLEAPEKLATVADLSFGMTGKGLVVSGKRGAF